MSKPKQSHSAELLPCPFCGKIPKIVNRDTEPQGDPWYGSRNEDFILCECGCCLFDGGFHEGFWNINTRGVEAWNKRAKLESAKKAQEWVEKLQKRYAYYELSSWLSPDLLHDLRELLKNGKAAE